MDCQECDTRPVSLSLSINIANLPRLPSASTKGVVSVQLKNASISSTVTSLIKICALLTLSVIRHNCSWLNTPSDFLLLFFTINSSLEDFLLDEMGTESPRLVENSLNKSAKASRENGAFVKYLSIKSSRLVRSS